MNKIMKNFQPTLFEKIFIFSHIPSTIGVLLVAFFVGPLGNFLYFYAISANAIDAFYRTFFSTYIEGINFTTAVTSYWYSFIGESSLVYIFVLCCISYNISEKASNSFRT